MLKRKYQPGGINEEGRLNTGAGKIDKSDTAKPVHESGQFVIGSALGKTGEDANVFYQADEETVNQLIANKKLNIDDPNQYRNGLEDIKIANSMGKEDDRSFDDYAVLQRQGVYGTNRGFQDKMKRDAKNFNKETYKNIGEERKEDRGKGRSLIARTAINLFTNDKRQGEKAIKSADKVRKAVMYRGAFERPEQPVTSNYSPTVEVTTPAEQTQSTNTDKKVDYEWKEFTNGNDPYKYRVALDKASGNPLMYEYSKDGKTWKQQEETDKGNRTMERQAVISNLWKNYQQNPNSMLPPVKPVKPRITTESQGVTLGNKPVSNPYQGYQPKTQPITANNTLSPEYIAQNGFTGSGGKPATGEQPDWKDYLTYGTVVAGGILGADQIGKLLKTSQNSLVRSAGRLFKPNVVNITENPAVERGVSRLAGKEGKMLLNRGQVKTNTPQNPAANQQNPTYSPEVQINTPNITDMSVGKAVKERFNNAMDYVSKLPDGQVKQNIQKDYFNMKANGIDENEIMQRINQKYSKDLGVSFKKGGLVRKHQFGKKLVEGSKRGLKEAGVDTVLTMGTPEALKQREFDWIDGLTTAASFAGGVPGVIAGGIENIRDGVNAYKQGLLTPAYATQLVANTALGAVPGARAAQKAYKMSRVITNPKTAKLIAKTVSIPFNR
jgi:hypothetical protein